MSVTGLRKHYESKYEHEAGGKATSLVTGWETPTDRFQAAVFAVHAHFNGGSILELGSGDGQVARTLLSVRSDIDSYVLSDWSEVRVAGLRESVKDERARVVCMNAEEIPRDFEDRFDAVIMVALIEHLIDPIQAMSRIREILKPDGWVYVDTPNVAKWTRRLKLLAGRFPSTASRSEGLETYEGAPVSLYDEGHLHYFTFRSLERMLLEHCRFSRTKRLGHYAGNFPFGRKAGFALARRVPTILSDTAVIAYR